MITAFSSLETAKSGLIASQDALSVTSKNISNASTDGYTRESAVFGTTNTGTGSTKFRSQSAVYSGGVAVTGVQQYRNTYLDGRYRDENSLLGQWNGLSSGLSEMEDIFNELNTSSSDELTGISGQMDTLFTSIESLQNDSTNTTLTSTVESNANTLCQMVQYNATQLNSLLSDTKSDLAVTITGSTAGTSASGGVNAILQNIQSLNTQIANYVAAGKNADDLLDARNLQLDKLSSYFSIDVTEQNDGMVTIGLAGDTSGKMLIDGKNQLDTLSVNSGDTAVLWSDGSTAAVTGGSVGADLELINGDTSTSLGIPYMLSKLNAFAQSFADAMNSVGQANNSGAADLITITDSGNAAATLGVSSAWNSDSSLILNNYTGTDTAGYVAQFVSLFSQNDLVTFNSSTYDGTLTDFADSLSLDVGNRLNYVQSMQTATETEVNDLDTQRQSVSSVSIDEEGVNILKFEQSYNASARVITAINDMLETLIKETAV